MCDDTWDQKILSETIHNTSTNHHFISFHILLELVFIPYTNLGLHYDSENTHFTVKPFIMTRIHFLGRDQVTNPSQNNNMIFVILVHKDTRLSVTYEAKASELEPLVDICSCIKQNLSLCAASKASRLLHSLAYLSSCLIFIFLRIVMIKDVSAKTVPKWAPWSPH